MEGHTGVFRLSVTTNTTGVRHFPNLQLSTVTAASYDLSSLMCWLSLLIFLTIHFNRKKSVFWQKSMLEVVLFSMGRSVGAVKILTPAIIEFPMSCAKVVYWRILLWYVTSTDDHHYIYLEIHSAPQHFTCSTTKERYKHVLKYYNAHTY